MQTKREEAQQRWDLLHSFCYSYICQVPKKYMNDEEYRAHRDVLFDLVANDVHRTNWKDIFSRYQNYLPIVAAYNAAKEYTYAAEKGQTTEEYEEIRGYVERMDDQRRQMRVTETSTIKTKRKK